MISPITSLSSHSRSRINKWWHCLWLFNRAARTGWWPNKISPFNLHLKWRKIFLTSRSMQNYCKSLKHSFEHLTSNSTFGFWFCSFHVLLYSFQGWSCLNKSHLIPNDPVTQMMQDGNYGSYLKFGPSALLKICCLKSFNKWISGIRLHLLGNAFKMYHSLTEEIRSCELICKYIFCISIVWYNKNINYHVSISWNTR